MNMDMDMDTRYKTEIKDIKTEYKTRTDGEYLKTGQFIAIEKPGRNELCACGSGKKHKKCCLGGK